MLSLDKLIFQIDNCLSSMQRFNPNTLLKAPWKKKKKKKKAPASLLAYKQKDSFDSQQ